MGGGGGLLSILQVCHLLEPRVDFFVLACFVLTSFCWDCIGQKVPYAALGKKTE
jgi:hypothetical protein